MATLSDEAFLHEVDALIRGAPNDLVDTPTPTPEVVPPVETPPVETPPVETPSVETSTDPVVETPETPPTDTPETPPADTPPVETPPVEPDYKSIYNKIFGTPFKAAGQDITVTDPDEAISLMQKGVGFHSKMNRIQSDLKYIEMLRNNDLLDESKLSLLIDAQAGKAGAIKKLLDSAKIDPLTLDSPEASTYAPSDHRVSDEQVRFQSVVDDIKVSPEGNQLLQEARGWDKDSKAEVFKNPDVLTALAYQKSLGRYDLIKTQVERDRAVGKIPVNESFLASYSRVGQQMMQAGAFGKPNTPTPTPVTQKTITPPAPANSKAAAAAGPTKRSTAAAPATVDTKEMSDEEFEKFVKKTYKL